MILSFKLKLLILLHTHPHTHPHTPHTHTKGKGKKRKEKKKKIDFLDGILFLFVVPSVSWFHRIEIMVSTPSQAPFP